MERPHHLVALGVEHAAVVRAAHPDLALDRGVAVLQRDAAGRTFAFSTGLYNYGYVPLPLAMSLFDRETVGVLIVHNLGTETAFWLLGTVVFAHAANEPLWKKILNPPLAAIALRSCGVMVKPQFRMAADALSTVVPMRPAGALIAK